MSDTTSSSEKKTYRKRDSTNSKAIEKLFEQFPDINPSLLVPYGQGSPTNDFYSKYESQYRHLLRRWQQDYWGLREERLHPGKNRKQRENEQRAIADEIIKQIHAYKGMFVKWNKENVEWEVITNMNELRKKVMQSFRDARKQCKDHSTKDDGDKQEQKGPPRKMQRQAPQSVARAAASGGQQSPAQQLAAHRHAYLQLNRFQIQQEQHQLYLKQQQLYLQQHERYLHQQHAGHGHLLPLQDRLAPLPLHQPNLNQGTASSGCLETGTRDESVIDPHLEATATGMISAAAAGGEKCAPSQGLGALHANATDTAVAVKEPEKDTLVIGNSAAGDGQTLHSAKPASRTDIKATEGDKHDPLETPIEELATPTELGGRGYSCSSTARYDRATNEGASSRTEANGTVEDNNGTMEHPIEELATPTELGERGYSCSSTASYGKE